MSKSDSNDDETVQVTMTRREYTALASSGVVLSHASNDDGGWLDGLLGGNDDDDGPGLFEDMEIRHEDSHVITDPDTIDFIGEALDVEMPNAYDNGVRIKVQGDVAVEGEDIEPSSVTTPTVATEVLNNATHFIATSDDPQTVADEASDGSTLAFLPGTHTLTGTFGVEITNSDVTVVILPGAELKHGDGEATGASQSESAVIRVGDGGTTTVRNVTVKGEGTINGNRANQTSQSTGVLFDNDCHDCHVHDVEIKEMAGSGLWTEGSTTRCSTIGYHGVHVHDVDEDGALMRMTDGAVWDQDFLVDTTTNQDGVEPVDCTDVRIVNGTVRDNGAGALIDIYSTCDTVIVDDVTLVHDQANAIAAITIGENTAGSNPSNVIISNCEHRVNTANSNARFLRVLNGGDVTVENCETDGAGTDPLDIQAGDVTLRGFVGTNLQAASTIDTADVELIDCEFEHSVVLTAAADNTIIRGGRYTTDAGHAIDATAGPDTITVDGVALVGGSATVAHLRIDGGGGPHRIRNVDSINSPDRGIRLQDAVAVVSGTVVDGAASDGIFVVASDGAVHEDLVVSGGTRVTGCGGDGFTVVENSGSYDYILVDSVNLRGNTGTNLNYTFGTNDIEGDIQA